MARITADSASGGGNSHENTLTLQAEGQDRIDLPSSDFVSDAHMTRDGNDLILQAPNGEVAVIENYFSVDPCPHPDPPPTAPP